MLNYNAQVIFLDAAGEVSLNYPNIRAESPSEAAILVQRLYVADELRPRELTIGDLCQIWNDLNAKNYYFIYDKFGQVRETSELKFNNWRNMRNNPHIHEDIDEAEVFETRRRLFSNV
jgi:hypothetical protein